MTALALLCDLRQQGIELHARGDRLQYRPVHAVGLDLIEQIKAHKPELLTILARVDVDTVDADKTPADGHGNGGIVNGPPELPDRPPDRSGYACELTYSAGAWAWRYRWLDRADAAYEQWKKAGGEFPGPTNNAAAGTPTNESSPTASVTIPNGWIPAVWAERLRQLADKCEAIRPDLAATYRTWADNINTKGAQ